MARKYILLQGLAMDSDSDMEPEEEDFFSQMVMILSLKVTTEPC